MSWQRPHPKQRPKSGDKTSPMFVWLSADQNLNLYYWCNFVQSVHWMKSFVRKNYPNDLKVSHSLPLQLWIHWIVGWSSEWAQWPLRWSVCRRKTSLRTRMLRSTESRKTINIGYVCVCFRSIHTILSSIRSAVKDRLPMSIAVPPTPKSEATLNTCHRVILKPANNIHKQDKIPNIHPIVIIYWKRLAKWSESF